MRIQIPTGMYDDSRRGFDVIDRIDGGRVACFSTIEEADYHANLLAAWTTRFNFGIGIRDRRTMKQTRIVRGSVTL